MKKILIAFLTIFAFTVIVFGQKTKSPKVDQTKAVRAIFDRLIEGIKQADAAKVMSVYENSARTLFFNNNGSATIGWENMKAVRENLYSKTTNVTIETTGLRIEMLSATSAYVSCKWIQKQEYEEKVENASGRMTLVFKLIGKDWKIVHAHTSPDTTKPDKTYLESERIIKDNP
jgi:ketosteroid isomerase-like protein